MPPPHAKLVAIATSAVACVLGVVRRVDAAPTFLAADLAYEAPAGCPSSAAFVRELESRARSVAVNVRPGAALRVRLSRSPLPSAHFVGELLADEGGVPSVERRVEGRSCEDVASAMALIAAMTLAGKPPEADAPAPSPAPSPVPAEALPKTTGAHDAVSPVSPSASQPRVTDHVNVKPEDKPATLETTKEWKQLAENAAEKQREKLLAKLEAAEDAQSAVTNSPRPPGMRGDVSIGGGLALGGPRPLGADLRASVGLHDSRSVVFSWDVRARVDVSPPVTDESGPGSVRFTQITGGLEVCPMGLSFGRARASLCASGDAGVLEAHPSAVPSPHDVVRPWADAGAGGRLRADLAGTLFVDADVAVKAAVFRDRFVFEPDTTVFRSGPVTASAALDLGVTF